MRKVYDVIGTTTYHGMDKEDEDDIRMAEMDCRMDAIPAMLDGHHFGISECEFANDWNDDLKIDWILSVVAKSAKEVEYMINNSKVCDSCAFEIYDVTKEVGGAKQFIKDFLHE